MTDETKPTKAADKSARAKSAGATGATGASGATGATGPADRNRATPVMETDEVQRGLEAKRAKQVTEAGGEPSERGSASTQAQETDNPWDRIYGPEDHPPVAETGDVEVPKKGYVGTQPGDEDFGRA